MINTHPTDKQLRWFALFWCVWAGLIGAVARARGHADAALTLWLFLGTMGLAAFAWLGVARKLFVGLSYLTYPIGWVIGRVLLSAVFFGVITPIGFIRRRLGAS